MSVKMSVHDDPKATQRIRLADALEPVFRPETDVDPKATRQLPDVPSIPVTPQVQGPPSTLRQSSGDSRETQEIRLPKARPPVRRWLARHKRSAILVGALAAIAILAISLAATQSARGVQRAAVGSIGQQMRAASLAQADLSGQDLKWADLSQADLRQANLSNADMMGADLTGAELGKANLEAAILRGADLSGAKLQGAVFLQADLHWALLRNADLSGADLRQANLQGADLENATLEGANLEGANLKSVHLYGTILPDGARWTPRINLRRFTDSSHPDFWRSEDAQSLALR